MWHLGCQWISRATRSRSAAMRPQKCVYSDHKSANTGENHVAEGNCSRTLELVDADRRLNIVGLTREELEQEFRIFQVPSYRMDQVWQWLYQKGTKTPGSRRLLHAVVTSNLRYSRLPIIFADGQC